MTQKEVDAADPEWLAAVLEQIEREAKDNAAREREALGDGMRDATWDEITRWAVRKIFRLGVQGHYHLPDNFTWNRSIKNTSGVDCWLASLVLSLFRLRGVANLVMSAPLRDLPAESACVTALMQLEFHWLFQRPPQVPWMAEVGLLRKVLGRLHPALAGEEQKDAQEGLEALFAHLPASVQAPFLMEVTMTTRCPACGFSRSEALQVLTLSLGGSSRNIDALLSEQLQPQPTPAPCERCGGTSMTCASAITRAPRILILHIVRWRSVRGRLEKVTTSVKAPLWLATRIGGREYRMVGNISHFGDFADGHYTSRAWDEEGDRWYGFDNSHIQRGTSTSAVEDERALYHCFYAADRSREPDYTAPFPVRIVTARYD
jgi:hypothetical protein